MQPAAGGFGQGDVAAGHHVLGGGGHSGQPEEHRHHPLVHHALLRQLADFGVVQHRLVEHQAILEGPPHQFGVADRVAVVGEGDRAGLDQLADLGQFLPLAILADAGHHEDVAVAGPFGPLAGELDGPLAVDGRVGIGHAGDRGEPAGQRGGRAGLDGLVLLEARLAEVDVHVDQAGRHDFARRVDHRFLPGRGGIVSGDAAVGQQQVGYAIHLLRWIDHAAVLD